MGTAVIFYLLFEPEAPHGGSRLHESAVARKVFVGEELPRLLLPSDSLEKGGRYLQGEEALSVLGEGGVVPDPLAERKTYKPPKE